MSTLYVHTAPHLAAGGDPTPAATMSLAQLCEGIAMLGISGLLLRFRIRWLLIAGLSLGILRYLLLATDYRPAMVASVALHGPLFVLFYMTSQIYLELRIDPAIRAQSQALLSIMNNGVGNLSGYLAIEVWHRHCLLPDGSTNWPRFWSWLAAAATILTAAFASLYRGQSRTQNPSHPA
jgi:drug/metabolite transporter (DMT)-like permease